MLHELMPQVKAGSGVQRNRPGTRWAFFILLAHSICHFALLSYWISLWRELGGTFLWRANFGAWLVSGASWGFLLVQVMVDAGMYKRVVVLAVQKERSAADGEGGDAGSSGWPKRLRYPVWMGLLAFGAMLFLFKRRMAGGFKVTAYLHCILLPNVLMCTVYWLSLRMQWIPWPFERSLKGALLDEEGVLVEEVVDGAVLYEEAPKSRTLVPLPIKKKVPPRKTPPSPVYPSQQRRLGSKDFFHNNKD